MTRRTTSAVAAATLASALLLTGCGTQDALVGLRPAPAEKSVSAPLGDEGAADIAARVLAQALQSVAPIADRGQRDGGPWRGTRGHP